MDRQDDGDWWDVLLAAGVLLIAVALAWLFSGGRW